MRKLAENVLTLKARRYWLRAKGQSIFSFLLSGVAVFVLLGTTFVNSAVSSHRLYVMDSSGERILVVDSESGEVRATFQTGYAADMVLSPNGKRLYVAYTKLGAEEPKRLSIIDALTGEVLRTVGNPHAMRWAVPPPFPLMAISADGRWLYFSKRRSFTSGHDEHFIATFDTRQGKFLPETAPLPQCAGSMLFPSDQVRRIFVVCLGDNAVHDLKLTNRGAVDQILTFQVGEPRKRGASGQLIYDGNADIIRHATLGVDARSLVLVKRRGRVLKISADSGETTEVASQIQPPRQPTNGPVAVLSRLGDRLYVPCESETGSREILAFDTKSMRSLGSLVISQGFQYLAVSPDGRTLYASVPEAKRVLVIDTAKMQRVREIPVDGKPMMIAVSSALETR